MSDEVQTEARETVTQALIVKSRAVTVVKNDEDFNAVESLMKSLKESAKANHEHIREWSERIAKQNKRRLEIEKQLIKDPESEAKRCKGLLNAFTLSEQRKAEAIAREAARKAQEAAESERLAIADTLDRAGRPDQSDAILELPVMPVITPPAKEVRKTAHVAKQWRPRIVDPKAFFAAYGSGELQMPAFSEAHLEQLKAMFGLQQEANRFGAQMKVPGVEVEERLI